MERKGRVLLFAACAAFLIGGLSARVALAQLPTGTISGTVKDATGAVVPGATVTLTNLGTGLAQTKKSGADGHYSFPGTRVGNYDVKAEAAGFQSQLQHNLALSVAQESVANFTLAVGAVQETVTVSAEAPLVDTTSGALGGLQNEATVTELPLNGRSFNTLVTLETGVTVAHPVSTTSSTSIGLSFSANGAPLRSNNMTEDGASITSNQGLTGVSSSGLMLGVDSVQEFRVINNNYPAEYGMTMGSQMMIITKSGTNHLHGTLFEFMRNDKIEANDFFFNSVNQPRPGFKRNNFGGSLGGPVRRDKDFFFVNYEGLRERLGIAESSTVPSLDMLAGTIYTSTTTLDPTKPCSQLTLQTIPISPAVVPYLKLFQIGAPVGGNSPIATDPCGAKGAANYIYNFNQPTNEDYGLARYDHTFSDKDQMFIRYTVDDSRLTQDNGFPEYTQTRNTRGQYITLAENHIFSPAVLNAVRLSYSRPFASYLFPVVPQTVGLEFYHAEGIQMGACCGGAGFSLGGGNPNLFDENLETLSDDLSWTKGKHSLKFGTLMNKVRSLEWTNNSGWGSWSFSTPMDFLADNPNKLTIIAPGSKTDRTFAWKTFGFYAEDEWRAFPRLTLNLGLRYEFNTTVNEVSGAASSYTDISTQLTGVLGLPLYKNPSLKNFGPRFGFAWDVFGNGKTSVRGGFGIFYDIANLAAAADIETTGTLPFSTTLSLSPANLPLCFPNCTAIPTIQQASQVSQSPPSPRTILYQQAQPHLLSYNMTIDRQLPGSMLLSIGYAGSRGLNIISTVDGNPIINISDGVYPLTLPTVAQCQTSPGLVGCRTNPLLNYCECKTTSGDSWYNALQVRLQKRLSHNLQFQVAYTFSKALDDTQGQHGGEAGGSSITGTDPFNRNTDKGPTDFNAPQWLAINGIYTLPSVNGGKGLVGGLASGWRMSSVMRVDSGLPFSVTESNCRSNSMVLGTCSDRLDVVPGCDRIQWNGDPNTSYFNQSCFTLQPGGLLGNESRNSLMGPKHVNMDFSLVKDTTLPHLGEGKHLEFRAEVFNLFNRPDFPVPSGRSEFSATATKINTAPAGTGLFTATQGDPREFQFALKFIF